MIVQDGNISGAVKTSSIMAGSSNTPSLALGSAAGNGATVQIEGNNVCGKIILNAGTGVLASGLVMTMTLADSLSFPNKALVKFEALNDNFSMVKGLLYYNSTTNTISLYIRTALSNAAQYIGSYLITGY